MDPTQALADLFSALNNRGDGGSLTDEDRDEALTALEALQGWLSGYGFAPDLNEAWFRAFGERLGR